MLSFKILTEEERDESLSLLSNSLPEADFEYLNEIIDSLIEEEGEVALAASDGCLLVRLFDGEYKFICPIALSDGADGIRAIDSLRSYAVKEEIPLVLTDVPAEELGTVAGLFRHANIDTEDDDRQSYTVRVMSEASLLDAPISVELSDMLLDAITADDDRAYAELCKDKDTNKYWGYDYSLDMPNPTDAYFREENEREIDRGVLMSLAVRIGGKFAGEAALYRFDLLGGCECAIRLLPEYRGAGHATRALSALVDIARRMGLIKLYATVSVENIPSVRMTEKVFGSGEISGEIIKFSLKL